MTAIVRPSPPRWRREKERRCRRGAPGARVARRARPWSLRAGCGRTFRHVVQPYPLADDQGRSTTVPWHATHDVSRVRAHPVNVRRWLLVAASFTATLGISAYILWSGWAKSGAPPTIPVAAHALALAAVIAEILTRTIKIQWSGSALRIPLRFSTALRVCLGGDFGASITPSRTGAEPARFLVLAEAGVPAAGTLLILFTELFLEMTSLCLLCAILAVAFSGSGRVVSLMTAMIGGYATIVVSIGALGYFLAHRSAHGPPPDWARSIGLHAGRWRVIQRAMRSLRSGIAALEASPARCRWRARSWRRCCT